MPHGPLAEDVQTAHTRSKGVDNGVKHRGVKDLHKSKRKSDSANLRQQTKRLNEILEDLQRVANTQGRQSFSLPSCLLLLLLFLLIQWRLHLHTLLQ